MIKAGITGGIGSGKTTIAKIFELLGIAVYNADIRAKELINTKPEIKTALIEFFGQEIYKNGLIDRKKLSDIVFNDKKALKKLNQIVHPEVNKDYNKWLENYSGKSYTLKEAALLFESESYKSLDYIITVYAPEETRIERIIKRDQIKREQVLARIRNQIDDKVKISQSHVTIYNDNKQLVIPQVISIHKTLISKFIRTQKNNDFKN